MFDFILSVPLREKRILHPIVGYAPIAYTLNFRPDIYRRIVGLFVYHFGNEYADHLLDCIREIERNMHGLDADQRVAFVRWVFLSSVQTSAKYRRLNCARKCAMKTAYDPNVDVRKYNKRLLTVDTGVRTINGVTHYRTNKVR